MSDDSKKRTRLNDAEDPTRQPVTVGFNGRALLFGNSEFDDSDHLPEIKFAARDVALMSAFLEEHGYQPVHCFKNLTAEEIRKRMRQFTDELQQLETKPEMVFVYFSTHGVTCTLSSSTSSSISYTSSQQPQLDDFLRASAAMYEISLPTNLAHLMPGLPFPISSSSSSYVQSPTQDETCTVLCGKTTMIQSHGKNTICDPLSVITPEEVMHNAYKMAKYSNGVFVVIDACHAGGIGQLKAAAMDMLASRIYAVAPAGKGVAVLTACSSDELAYGGILSTFTSTLFSSWMTLSENNNTVALFNLVDSVCADMEHLPKPLQTPCFKCDIQKSHSFIVSKKASYVLTNNNNYFSIFFIGVCLCLFTSTSRIIRPFLFYFCFKITKQLDE